MEKLLGTLAFTKVPRLDKTRKREQRAEKDSIQEKKPRLLEDILTGENPPSLVPSYTSEGIEITKEKSSNWKQVPLPLAKKETIEKVTHWVKVGSEPYVPPTDISDFPTSVLDLTEEDYEACQCGDEQWNFKNTKYLFTLCKTYNLRWPAIIDMMSTCTNFNLEACQLRFYKVTKSILSNRNLYQGRTLTPEEDYLLSYSFDTSFSKNRRQAVDRSFLLSNVCNTTEKKLYDRLQAIDAQLFRINNVI